MEDGVMARVFLLAERLRLWCVRTERAGGDGARARQKAQVDLC